MKRDILQEIVDDWLIKLQDDIDKEILERYEWDWEFRKSVDEMVDKNKNES
jgi:hypothetical protein